MKETKPGRLAGLNTLVIGAGSGIGRAVVEAFLSEGACVSALDHDAEKCASLRSLPDLRAVFQADATVLSEAAHAIDGVLESFGGRLDVLVNCVGIFDFYRGLATIPPEELGAAFDEMMRTNVLSQLLPARLAIEPLRRQRGTIILTSSSSAFYPGRGGILYVSSKFAIRGAVKSLAFELAPDIRVNSVAPGGTLGTDLRGVGSLGLQHRRIVDSAERIADLELLTPLRCALSPEEIAPSYVFLASREARGMTGEVLHPDGGLGVRG